ncbi:MAG: amino acid ABC transporter permease [Oscillospiraceae bacterium]|nr:amino acid ABC transporter permease [Oscillospiraceae bacterium]
MMEEIALIFTSYNISYIVAGLGMTLLIAVITLFGGTLFGTVLALLNTYGGKFGKIAAVIVEIFRNTPLLLWVFVAIAAVPLPSLLSRALVATVIFNAAIISEIIRGGLNAVPKGQIEAGRSQGFSFVQIMVYIILPQTFRRIIPTLTSQSITIIKDTSYLAQIGVAELMFVIKKLMSTANSFTGHSITAEDVFILFGTAAIIYFIINFSLSVAVRKMQKKIDITMK